MNYLFSIFVAFVFAFASVGAFQTHSSEHSWDYSEERGPGHWGDLKPEFSLCKNGLNQSPIDISNPQPADLPSIQFDYHPSSLHIIDNGHTIQVNYAAGSSITVDGSTFALKQFHFHRPSEEKLNGKSYDMVVHLVHQNAAGNLAVVAVLLTQATDNALLRQLWAHLPNEKEKEETRDDIQIDVNALLPAERGYYSFKGSLTTPPCSEGVTWYVLKQPVAVSARQIAEFSKIYPHNARPTQPLNGRVVLESR